MGNADAIAALEKRAETAGYTMGQVCEEAGAHLSVWSRAKGRGRISEALHDRMFDAMTRLETRKAEAA